MQLFDTHAHLDDDQLSSDIAQVIARAAAVGVSQILAVGTCLASSRRCADLAAQHPGIVAAAGIHPNHSHQALSGDWEGIVRLAEERRIVALGETGLDRHWDFAPFELQQDYFARHLRLAQEHDLPVVIHERECQADILASLRAAVQRGPLRGIQHSFSGDEAYAEACLELGLSISFSGMVTFKKSEELREVAARIPADRLLVETDSPYLSPHPHRGQRPNEPALVVHTAACVAEARGISLAELAKLTTANACRLFGIAPPAAN